MSFVTGLFVYIIIWWVVFFAVLPWGVERHEETTPGLEAGAPARARMGLKVLVTSLIALVASIGFYWLEQSDLITFRDLV